MVFQECPAVESVTDFAQRVCAEHLTINEDRESYRGIQMWPTAGANLIFKKFAAGYLFYYSVSSNKSRSP